MENGTRAFRLQIPLCAPSPIWTSFVVSSCAHQIYAFSSFPIQIPRTQTPYHTVASYSLTCTIFYAIVGGRYVWSCVVHVCVYSGVRWCCFSYMSLFLYLSLYVTVSCKMRKHLIWFYGRYMARACRVLCRRMFSCRCRSVSLNARSCIICDVHVHVQKTYVAS